jgi:Tfp pilus assembly protein PilO
MDRVRLVLMVALGIALAGLAVGGVVLKGTLDDLEETRRRATSAENTLEQVREEAAIMASMLSEVRADGERLQSELDDLDASLRSQKRSARKCVRTLSEAGAGYSSWGYQVWIVDLLYGATEACEAATGEQFYPWLSYDF